MHSCPYCNKNTARKVNDKYLCSNCGAEFKGNELFILNDMNFLARKRELIILMESMPTRR